MPCGRFKILLLTFKIDPMQIKTLSGHLTSTNKTHIKAMFEKNTLCAKVNIMHYKIVPENKIFHVTIVKTDNSIVIGEKKDISKATFKII